MDPVEKIIWTEKGIESFEEIIQYIEKDSPFYACQFAHRVMDAIELLSHFPLMGRKVPEFNEERLRELIYQNYRILYKVDQENIYLLLVCHGMKILPQNIE